jgi:hypothetical protein
VRLILRWIVLAAIALVHGSAVQAAERGGAFAIRGGSARSAVLGDTYGAVAGDVEAAAWNPASLVLIPSAEIQATYHDLYGLGLARHSSLRLGWRRGTERASLDGNRIRLSTERDAGPAVGVGLDVLGVDLGEETYTEYRPSLTLAAPLAGGGSIGASAHYLRASSGISGVRATGYALDIGLQQPVGRWRASVTFHNALGRLSWKEGQEEDRPREATVALATNVSRVTLAAGVVTSLTDRFVERYTAAAEALVMPSHWALLVGWSALRSGDEFDGALAFGTRFRTQRVGVDYAFEPETYTPGDSHRVTLTVVL